VPFHLISFLQHSAPASDGLLAIPRPSTQLLFPAIWDDLVLPCFWCSADPMPGLKNLLFSWIITSVFSEYLSFYPFFLTSDCPILSPEDSLFPPLAISTNYSHPPQGFSENSLLIQVPLVSPPLSFQFRGFFFKGSGFTRRMLPLMDLFHLPAAWFYWG